MMIDDKDKIYSTFLSIVSLENYFLKNGFSVLCINYTTLTELETFVLDTHIPIVWSRYSLRALLIWVSILNLYISVLPPGYDVYHADKTNLQNKWSRNIDLDIHKTKIPSSGFIVVKWILIFYFIRLH